MRLRVTVRRHGLPDTPVIWVIDTNAAPTVFQLLEQINEIIPIESDGEWGLDDYAVELKGLTGVNYECLHFQPVASVMKEEDEVLIRPLLSQDIKIRRISGRRQISSYGAHLLDGVVFGRPLLRLSDRPSIHIPPRKKRRITSEEEDVEDDQESLEGQLADEIRDDSGNRQLVLHADFDDEDSEADEDFAPSGAEDDDDDEPDEDVETDTKGSDAEMRDDQQRINSDEEEQVASLSDKVTDPCLAGVKDPTTRAKIHKLHAAFPSAKLGVCRHVMKGTQYDLSDAYDAMLTGFPAVQPKSTVIELSEGTGSLVVHKTRGKAPAAAVKPPEVLDNIQEEPGESPNPMFEYYDQNGLPPGSIASGKALSFMADALKRPSPRHRLESRISSVVSGKDVSCAPAEDAPVNLKSQLAIDKLSDEDESSEEESDESSEEDSSSDEESSEASTDSSDDEMDNIVKKASSSSSDSDSSSDSSSDEDEPEERSSKVTSALSSLPVAKTASDLQSATSKSRNTQCVAPPGNGMRWTHSRNERRRRAHALKKYKDKAILPANTTIEEFKLLDPNQLGSPDVASAALAALRATQAAANENKHTIAGTTQTLLADAEKFELRRKELLASLAQGGIEVEKESVKKASKKKPVVRLVAGSAPAAETKMDGVPDAIPVDIGLLIDTSSNILASETATAGAAASEMDVVEEPNATPQSQNIPAEATPMTSGLRRTKLDLGAGRRMLFGALGIKNPKTKKDEEKVRSNLMKDVRPLGTPKFVDEPKPATEEVIDENPDAWKANIIYRAVECVQEDVDLSEPPFPFQQRWDPQQWHDRNGKRKKDQRDQAQFYDETRPSKKQKRRKGKNNRREEHGFPEQPLELSYDDSYDPEYDEPTRFSKTQAYIEGEQDQQHDMNAPSIDVSQKPDDLAPLPEDPTSLPDLAKGAAKIGMTIAFKCLEMSEATKWQPKISPYRTAIVISISNNGELQLGLAIRDRQIRKLFDEETGERIYGKFEMPDDEDDDEMDEEDNGIVNHQYGELVEPRIVQEPPGSLSADSQVDNVSQSDERPKGDTSATMSNEDGSAEMQFAQTEGQLSHVTETPLSDGLEQAGTIQIDEVVESASVKELPDIVVSAESSQEVAFNIPVANTELTMEMTAPVTPGLRAREISNTEVLTPSAQISEENRRNISHMMKDAGFRSSIPSSIARGIHPQTPGDTAEFHKLMEEMTEAPPEMPYSPKFHGFDSSPPTKEADIRFDTKKSSPAAAAQPLGFYKAPRSGWEAVHPQLESPTPTPPPAGQTDAATIGTDGAADKTVDSSDEFGSPTPEPAQPLKKILPRKVPVSKAQLLWEQLQPNSRRASTDSYPDSENISQATSIEFDGSAEMESNVSVKYPKLSIGSSFTSQITDHGRQPDFEFEESELLSAETAKVLNAENISETSTRWELETVPISANLVSKSKKMSHFDQRFSDSEVNVPFEKSTGGRSSSAGRPPKVLEGQSSSDELPSLAVLSQQSQAFKMEKPKSIEPRITQTSLKTKAVAMLEDAAEAKATPTGKQRKSIFSASQPRYTQHGIAQPTAPHSRMTQSQSAVVDLTQSSSEVDEKTAPAYKHEPKESKRSKRSAPLPSEDENDVDDGIVESGWIPKKKSAISNGGGGGQRSAKIKESSQAVVKTRRKTSRR